jgi:hypothetical protein
MKVETKHLQTVGNYAKEKGVTASYYYRLIREGKLTAYVEIDGVIFIDLKKISK